MIIDFDKNNLIPVIVQDNIDNTVLMLAYSNKEAFDKTIETGFAHYWSRSRNKIWKKGEESGNFQKIISIFIDCDNDTILYKVNQIGGAACHTGYRSCFFRELINNKLITKEKRIFDPNIVYISDYSK